MHVKSGNAPIGSVLLAAGSGSRLSPLTNEIHKSLLPIGGVPVIEHTLNSILEAGVSDVVVVVGDRRDVLESFLRSRFPGVVRTVFNPDFTSDKNLGSLDIGVENLRDPNGGYLVVETDVVLEPKGWSKALAIENLEKSFWVSKGQYSESLLGGCLNQDHEGNVLEIAYSPIFESRFLGWSKLLGILYVGSGNAKLDRALRKRALMNGPSDYYMSTWVENPKVLHSQNVDVSEFLGGTFNDLKSYLEIRRRFASRTEDKYD